MKMRIPRNRIQPQVLAKAKHLDTLQHREIITRDFGGLITLVVMERWYDPGERIAPT